MALTQSALIKLLQELELTDTTERIRLLTQRAFQELINAEAETVIGAAPYERSDDRTTQRNGTRSRTLSTSALRQCVCVWETDVYDGDICVPGGEC